MKFWKLVFYTGKGDYETNELILTNDEYDKVQAVLSKGVDLIILKGRQTIKRTSIASITDCTGEIQEYKEMGVQIAGILDDPKPLLGSGDKRDFTEVRRAGLSKLGDWVKSQSWYREVKEHEKK